MGHNSQFSKNMSVINIKSLQSLVDKPNSCIVKRNEKLQLLVLPAYFNDINAGIEAALQELTVGYNKQ